MMNEQERNEQEDPYEWEGESQAEPQQESWPQEAEQDEDPYEWEGESQAE